MGGTGRIVIDQMHLHTWAVRNEARFRLAQQRVADGDRSGAAVLMRRFGNKTGALPFTVVVDARHVVCASRLGAVDADWIAAAARACGAQASR